MTKIKPKEVLYIKLGPGGEYVEDCIKRGRVKIGYHDVSLLDIKEERWDEILNIFSATPTSHRNQVRKFALADEQTLWITFHNDKWLC